MRNSERNTSQRPVELHMIGANRKTAEQFFKLLIDNGIRRVIDVRRLNNGNLLGFTKRTHLEYFLQRIAGIHYKPMLDLAPDRDLLKAWKRGEVTWGDTPRGSRRFLAKAWECRSRPPRQLKVETNKEWKRRNRMHVREQFDAARRDH